MTKVPLTRDDRLRIRRAVAAAEAHTAGEIFVVVAEESDDYRFIPLLWATIAALVVPLPLIGLTAMPAALIYLAQLAVFIVLAIGFSHPAVKPAIVPPAVKRSAARGLAVQQFLAHGLHTTEARTGVLIFVSLAERYAEIIADAGISGEVDNAVWDASMAKLTGEIRAGRLAEGLIAAVENTGRQLARHFPPRDNDRDELSNDLVIL
jgi:putative membrane protein